MLGHSLQATRPRGCSVLSYKFYTTSEILLAAWTDLLHSGAKQDMVWSSLI